MADVTVPTPPSEVPATPQVPQAAAPNAVPGVPATPATAQSVAAPQEQATTQPGQVDENALRAKYEQDIARVKSAEQRRAAELQRQLMAERQARIQLEQQATQRALQGMTPEERAQFEQKVREQELQNRAAQIEQQENALRQRALIEQAKSYKEALTNWYVQYGKVPLEALDTSSPEAMQKSAILYHVNKETHAQTVAQTPPPTQVTVSTGGAVSPGGILGQLAGKSWAERQKIYAQMKNK